ncbi:PGAP1-domain-containing protein [Choiromyces venosus 120613-1]|uniref:GPI inositol-deacylase n=1 Tax=Choiromyces venosus 120613-1 TaxID=1336337 RepID=A0A3N4JCT3_9PEZI|nr:PGAP1-domain-containing protein [Choiromyces venosus 120613-1]
MRSRRSSRDSKASITAEESEDSESLSVDGHGEGQLAAANKSRSPGGEKEKVDSPSAKGLWNPPRDREPLDATTPPTLPKEKMEDTRNFRRPRLRSAWLCSLSTLGVTFLSAFVLWTTIRSFRERQCDIKGCRMPQMSPVYIREKDFDTEHTRFASKYNLYLYREHNVDIEYPPKGVPVLFIPGNAGSYKQVRPIAAEAARYFKNAAAKDESLLEAGQRGLDFFTVDFNEDITAFHGQTMLDQAEYLNEAVSYILSLYHDSRKSTMDSDLPDPSSVILFGHSMGGIVARTMLIMPNYQSNSINTIITMSAPHARPPAPFDKQIVETYDDINNYWRKSFSAKWANNNPLWHVTLVSIAGGGLDTIVPSDYASISSLVPDTHGFTVFTSSIPNVWVGVDHLAILWCDQLMKVVARSMLDIVDVTRPGQTKARAERMRLFKKWYLTGMEPIAEKTLPHKDPTTLLTLDDSHSIVNIGQRLKLDGARDGKLEVLYCSVFPLQAGQTAALFSMNMDLSGDSSGSTRLACKNAAEDVIELPASVRASRQPFEQAQPFSYLQYDLEDIAEHQFVAIVDKASRIAQGWVIAEFVEKKGSYVRSNASLRGLLMDGVRTTLPAERPFVTEIHIPVMHSSLLTYKMHVGVQSCGEDGQLFTPLLRQYLVDPYESKFFVNVHSADINLHGSAPFIPPALRPSSKRGLSLQLWLDPTCNSTVEVSVEFDFLGSLGRLAMRYRTVFAAFPLLVVALVLRIQFQEYDNKGRFMSFGEGLDRLIPRTLPYVLVALSALAISLSFAKAEQDNPVPSPLSKSATEQSTTAMEFAKNDLLVGLQDPFFWFLAPLFALIAVGVCVVLNYGAMLSLHSMTTFYTFFSKWPTWISSERRSPAITSAFSTSSPRRRIMTTLMLLFFVATLIPYQFAYMVACIVQIATCVRALKFARENRSGTYWDFYHYTHSILIVMLWILPINLPVLAVWIHNLTVHWLTPFSSHHNLLSIMPFILLVETLTTGNMIPRIKNRLWLVTNLLLLGLAAYAALYGVTYAYRLHHLVNFIAGWFVIVHFSTAPPTISGIIDLFNDDGDDDGSKKRHQ